MYSWGAGWDCTGTDPLLSARPVAQTLPRPALHPDLEPVGSHQSVYALPSSTARPFQCRCRRQCCLQPWDASLLPRVCLASASRLPLAASHPRFTRKPCPTGIHGHRSSNNSGVPSSGGAGGALVDPPPRAACRKGKAAWGEEGTGARVCCWCGVCSNTRFWQAAFPGSRALNWVPACRPAGNRRLLPPLCRRRRRRRARAVVSVGAGRARR